MQKRTAHVQVVLLAAQHIPRDKQVYQKSEHGHRQHRAARHGHGVEGADNGFNQNPCRHHHQREAVERGGQDFHTLIAVAFLRVGGLFRPFEGEKRKGERGGIGKHVPRVRQEREAAAEPACRRFHQHEAGNHGQRYA